MSLDDPWPLLLGVVVGVLAVARVVRLIVDDEFPPIVSAVAWWRDRASVDWKPLVDCPWCTAPYLALPAVLWFSSLIAWPGATWNLWLWWIVNGWAAVSWAVAYICLRDVPPESRE